jgi:hypothetical protein
MASTTTRAAVIARIEALGATYELSDYDSVNGWDLTLDAPDGMVWVSTTTSANVIIAPRKPELWALALAEMALGLEPAPTARKAPLAKPESTQCERCGKELVSEDSMAAGIGPICAAGGRGGASKDRAQRGIAKALGTVITFEIKKVGDKDYALQVFEDGKYSFGVMGVCARDCYGTALIQARAIAQSNA